jgi:crotonobetainyl-CoA:carnitine CoA-transferase CaiB-like acyl-CoA transferase
MTRFRERTLEEWMQVFLADPDIPFEVVVSSEEALSHPQIIHNKDWVLIDDPTVGPMKQVGPIGHFSETPSVIGNPAPALGQHNPLPHPTKNRSSADGTGKAPPPHPLHGVSIVECGYFYAMPFGVTLAASLGARVFKIEPIEGDPMRFGFNFPEAGAVKTMEGKESIPIDMKTPEGQKIIHQLVAKADVFVTSFRPGVPERLKVDYQTLRKINPRLVYVHATGYGTTGPYSHRPTYAGTASAAAGQLARQARYWLDPKQAEDRNLAGLKELASRVRALVDGDANGALGVATATALAIFHQRRTGQGQFVATTQVGGNLYAYSDDFTSYKGKAPVPVPDPDYYGLHALYRLYQAQRGWVFLACTSQEEWERFCSLTGQEGLLHDPRFATPLARKQHDHELIASLIALFAQRPADEWENHLAPRGVGCVRVFEPPSGGLVNWYPEFSCTDPALKEMGLVAEVEHPLFGRIVRHGLPVIFSETPGRIAPGCMIGQHTEAILMELGYTSEQIQQLIQQRVVTSVAKGVPTQQR